MTKRNANFQNSPSRGTGEPSQKEWYTCTQAAAIIGCHKDYVRYLVRHDKLEATQHETIPGSGLHYWMINPKSVKDFVAVKQSTGYPRGRPRETTTGAVKATALKVTETNSRVKKASRAKAAEAAVKKVSRPKVEAPVKAEAKAKPARVQLLPTGVSVVRVPQGTGFREIRLQQKAIMTLAVLQAAEGRKMHKAEIFAAIRDRYKIDTSQNAFRVDAQCHALEAAGLAVMRADEGRGRAQPRNATELGMAAKLPSAFYRTNAD